MKKLWNKFISSEILPITFGILTIVAGVSGLGLLIMYFIKTMLTMLGVL